MGSCQIEAKTQEWAIWSFYQKRLQFQVIKSRIWDLFFLPLNKYVEMNPDGPNENALTYSVFHDGHISTCKIYCFIRHSDTSSFKRTPVAAKSAAIYKT